ncbi:MAG: hypothetical protein AB7U75_03560 [Hyphomicrobiaceae bacterium]
MRTNTSRLAKPLRGLGRIDDLRGTIALLIGLLAAAPPAMALEVLPDEKASREACERRFCEIVLDGKEQGPPLACDMTKTWDRVKIKKNGEKNALSWGFGDARCKVTLKIPRDKIVPAFTEDKHTFQFERQTIDCKVEGADNKLNTLEVDAAPKIKFKNGHAYKVWINVEDVRGDSGLKTLVWTASKLADNVGLFHSATVKEINKFIHKTCKADYGKDAKHPKDAPGGDKPLRADAR